MADAEERKVEVEPSKPGKDEAAEADKTQTVGDESKMKSVHLQQSLQQKPARNVSFMKPSQMAPSIIRSSKERGAEGSKQLPADPSSCKPREKLSDPLQSITTKPETKPPAVDAPSSKPKEKGVDAGQSVASVKPPKGKVTDAPSAAPAEPPAIKPPKEKASEMQQTMSTKPQKQKLGDTSQAPAVDAPSAKPKERPGEAIQTLSTKPQREKSFDGPSASPATKDRGPEALSSKPPKDKGAEALSSRPPKEKGGDGPQAVSTKQSEKALSPVVLEGASVRPPTEKPAEATVSPVDAMSGKSQKQKTTTMKVVQRTPSNLPKPAQKMSRLDRMIESKRKRAEQVKKAKAEESEYVKFRVQNVLSTSKPQFLKNKKKKGKEDDSFPRAMREQANKDMTKMEGPMAFGLRKAYFLNVRPNPRYATWFGKKKQPKKKVENIKVTIQKKATRQAAAPASAQGQAVEAREEIRHGNNEYQNPISSDGSPFWMDCEPEENPEDPEDYIVNFEAVEFASHNRNMIKDPVPRPQDTKEDDDLKVLMAIKAPFDKKVVYNNTLRSVLNSSEHKESRPNIQSERKDLKGEEGRNVKWADEMKITSYSHETKPNEWENTKTPLKEIVKEPPDE